MDDAFTKARSGKVDAAMEKIRAQAEEANVADRPAALSALADAERALKRIAKRAETVPSEYERVELPCAHGPTIEMSARLLASTKFETRGRETLEVQLQLWESRGGTLVPTTYRRNVGSDADWEIEAKVIEPSDDAQAMRFAVMDAWEWSLRARSMVRRLGWSLRQDID